MKQDLSKLQVLTPEEIEEQTKRVNAVVDFAHQIEVPYIFILYSFILLLAGASKISGGTKFACEQLDAISKYCQELKLKVLRNEDLSR